LEIPVPALKPTLFRRKSPSLVDIVNTGIVEGAFAAPLFMSKSAIPPPALQLAAIWANSVGVLESRVSAKQIRPLAAGGTSVGEPPPLGTKTKLLLIAALMSAGVGLAFEVVDQVAGIHFGLTAQPAVFAGWGPLFRISTLFWAAIGATVHSKMPAHHNNASNFFIGPSP
jgi:hypothetical protein